MRLRQAFACVFHWQKEIYVAVVWIQGNVFAGFFIWNQLCCFVQLVYDVFEQ
ncbi:hypothetical protein [Thermaerobacillus caldiproteolyticus]|uniref:hypothetical protein n=1 Tax=Thermaerobacillus caldiproteolyticus TaxID=247480 RepID=UPI0018F1C49F|nr:hypothetical protein [Anoxybacillus caldiproteolyticus]